MLLHVKSTILHCPSSKITRQRASVDSKLLRRPRNVGYYTAQTPLNRSVAGILYNKVCNKCSDKSNRWSWCLSLSVATSAVGAINISPSPTTLLISGNGEPWRIFLSPQLRIQNGTRVQNHAPFRGDLSSHWQSVTDTHTHTHTHTHSQTHDDSIYRASTASRDKNIKKTTDKPQCYQRQNKKLQISKRW